MRQKPDHPPLTLMFTVREESGLWGARYLDKADLGGVKMGFNFDGGAADNVVIGAVGADRWEVEIFGRASHAGGSPEKGISATLIFAKALAAVHAGDWFGKVVKKGQAGTSNVGHVSGQNAVHTVDEWIDRASWRPGSTTVRAYDNARRARSSNPKGK